MKMTHNLAAYERIPLAERRELHERKKERILAFLASGHIYFAVEIAESLLGVSRQVAVRILQKLEAEGALRSTSLLIARDNGDPRKARIWGLTDLGLALADAPTFLKPFNPARLNNLYVPHHLAGQHARLAGEQAGWNGWTHEIVLRNVWQSGKIPDAVAVDPFENTTAIEIERTPKGPAGYQEAVAGYRRLFKSGRVDRVAYIVKDGVGKRVERLLTAAGAGKRFQVFEFAGWPDEPLPRTIESPGNAEKTLIESREKAQTNWFLGRRPDTDVELEVKQSGGFYSVFCRDKLIFKTACFHAFEAYVHGHLWDSEEGFVTMHGDC